MSDDIDNDDNTTDDSNSGGGLAAQISESVAAANDGTDEDAGPPSAEGETYASSVTDAAPAAASDQADDATSTGASGGANHETGGSDNSDGEADGDADSDDGTPEPRTLAETGLLDDDGQYPWDSDSETVVSGGKELEREVFTYLDIPFEITEPRDAQKLENAADGMEGLQDARKPERQRIIQRYFERLADVCLTVDGTPHDEVYAVRRDGGDGRRDVLTHEVAAKYDLVDSDGDVNQRRANELDVSVSRLWDDLTEFQRTKLGQKMDGMTSGESSFRLRFR